jgi:hypothetical protein
MSTFTQVDKALRAAGWRYDTGEEEFFDGTKRLTYRKILAFVLGMALDELASYQDDKFDRRGIMGRKGKQAAKKVMRKKG